MRKTQRLNNFSNASFLKKLHFKLIELVIGKRTGVVCNVSIEIVDQEKDELVSLKNMNGLLCYNSNLPYRDRKILEINSMKD